jgi:septal ring factor EnvC (AmiA/AmiB activator)
VEYLKRTIDSTKQRAAERRESEEKAHAEEVDRLQRANETLKTSLEQLLGAPKK